MKYNTLDRARQFIHHGALTNSKRLSCFIEGVYPSHVKRGRGCFLFDENDNKYVDFICALGSNLFGYANPEINEVVVSQLMRGSNFSLGSTLEVDAAERLIGKVLFCDKLRFLKTGTEACLASLKIARAHTARQKVLSEGYHGYSDEFVSLTQPALGVPDQSHIEKLTSLEQIDESIAAVIVEPVITDTSEARIQFLRDLRERTSKHGVVLIFDEIITGVRFKEFTVAQTFGVLPDILLLGKALGGGLPLSAVLTRKGIGENLEWFVSSTFAGDTLALSAMIKCMNMLETSKKIETLWVKGSRFIEQFNLIDPQIISIEGYGTRGVLVGETINKALFMQEMCKAQFLFGPTVFFCFDHLDYFDIALNASQDVIRRIKQGQVALEGRMPQSPFAQRMREK